MQMVFEITVMALIIWDQILCLYWNNAQGIKNDFEEGRDEQYLIMKSIQASGRFRKASTTGQYSFGSNPKLARISATSSASEVHHDNQG